MNTSITTKNKTVYVTIDKKEFDTPLDAVLHELKNQLCGDALEVEGDAEILTLCKRHPNRLRYIAALIDARMEYLCPCPVNTRK